MSNEEDIWPDVPRRAFVEDGPSVATACVRWVLDHRADDAWDCYRMAYEEAANAMLERVLAKKISPDLAFFPMVYLWRHHFELALKSIIVTGLRLDDEPAEPPMGHDLIKLWKGARPVLERAQAPNRELDHVERQLAELTAVDPTATGFRYPNAPRSPNRALAAIPERINLVALHEAMRAVSRFLHAASCELNQSLEHIEWERAQVAEYEREAYGGCDVEEEW